MPSIPGQILGLRVCPLIETEKIIAGDRAFGFLT